MAIEPIHFDEPLVFVGGSDVNWAHLKTQKELRIVAVDGGANALHAQGIEPDYLCGDFDSIHQELLKPSQSEIVALPDQDFTDFSKALDHFDAPVIYAYGFMGGRIDHNLDALAQIAARETRRIYLIGADEIAFVFLPKGEMSIQNGARISLWSTGEAQIIQSTGLKWPLNGMTISAASMSISNEAIGDGVMIDYAGAPLIAFAKMGAFQL